MNEFTVTFFPWLLVALSLIGTFLVTKRHASGFIFWIVANIGWVVIDYRAGLYSQAALFGAYLALAIYGLYEWGKGDKV